MKIKTFLASQHNLRAFVHNMYTDKINNKFLTIIFQGILSTSNCPVYHKFSNDFDHIWRNHILTDHN